MSFNAVQYKKNWYERNKKRILNERKEYYLQNKTKIILRVLEDYQLNKDRILQYHKNYYKKNKPLIKTKQKIYNIKNKLHINAHRRLIRKTNFNFKIRDRITLRINRAIHSHHKSKPTLELLGCSIEELKKHLESQFKLGMTWDNYGKGGWEIDHIRPCASFDLSIPKEQQKCFNYTNLQPLWAEENRKKGAKWKMK